MSVEVDTDNLRTTGPIELQKLGVVPQTVFLRASGSDTGSRMSRLSHRSPQDLARSPGTPRSGRTLSMDYGTAGGAPFEDLRRRLAIINGSGTSLAQGSGRDVRSPTTSTFATMPTLPPTTSDLPPAIDRPASPNESVVSEPS